MSKFNKIYEYEYHLFGQVSESYETIRRAQMQMCVCSFVFHVESDVSRFIVSSSCSRM